MSADAAFNPQEMRIYKGEAKSFDLAFTNGDGTPLNLDNVDRLLLTVKASKGGEVLLTKDSNQANHFDILDAENGLARVNFVAGDTSTLSVACYLYDQWTILIDGTPHVTADPGNFWVDGPVMTEIPA